LGTGIALSTNLRGTGSGGAKGKGETNWPGKGMLARGNYGQPWRRGRTKRSQSGRLSSRRNYGQTSDLDSGRPSPVKMKL